MTIQTGGKDTKTGRYWYDELTLTFTFGADSIKI
jgi:hypothetical protein